MLSVSSDRHNMNAGVVSRNRLEIGLVVHEVCKYGELIDRAKRFLK